MTYDPMRRDPTLTITLDRGDFKPITVVVPLTPILATKVLEPLELSNDAFTLYLKGAVTKGSYIQHRASILELREDVAHMIGEQVVAAFLEMVKKSDTFDSYPLEDKA